MKISPQDQAMMKASQFLTQYPGEVGQGHLEKAVRPERC